VYEFTQTWVILAAGAAHKLFVLRFIFRLERQNYVDAPIFDETLIAAHKICASAEGQCHERDPALPDRLDIHNVKSDLQYVK